MEYIQTFRVFENRVPKNERHDIFRNEKYILVSPLTHRASCKYGSYSDWCISVPYEDYIWDNNSPNNREAIVVILIQRGLSYTPEKEEIIHKYNQYYRKIELEGIELSEEEQNDMVSIRDSGEWMDLRKIAFIYSKRNDRIEVWANNNIEITDDVPNLYMLDIDSIIIEKLLIYIDENK